MDNGKKKILLIDDDETQHQIAENMLNAEYEVIKVKSGKDALKYLYDGNFIPCLILLDILMPEMDGWEVFSRVKAVSLLKSVPIIFVTAVNASTEEKRAFDIGAADFIKKPYDKEDLLSRINKVIV
ncbi:MAG: response regulator [Treponema sp.]|nr:response regulator [Treponema sp.]MCL2272863.1 response regulator [Treponema sp.]